MLHKQNICFVDHRVKDAALVAELRENIRRQLNLLYAVVRQQIREKQEGFEPGCLIEGKPFEENWQLDPVVPRISGLMTVDEFKTLNSLPAPMRPAWVQVQLNMNAQLLSRHLEEPGFYVQIFSRNAEDVMNLFKSAFRIVSSDDTSVSHNARTLLCCSCNFRTGHSIK